MRCHLGTHTVEHIRDGTEYMIENDFSGLPDQTIQFVQRLYALGVERTRVHGLFVMLGLYAGTPRPLDEIESLFRNLDPVVPIDRSVNIDEVVGEFYDGYEREINELCFRSGAEFEFRQINVPPVEKNFAIVYLKDEGVLDTDVISIQKLSDSFSLFDAFISAIGRSTATKNRSLLDAFSCGVFQMQLHAQMDVKAAQQISILLRDFRPLFYGQCINALSLNRIEYFLGLEAGQIALLQLMSSLETNFAQQMWGFQSRLFYEKGGSAIEEVEALDIEHWHAWVVKNAIDFYQEYGTQIQPFSSAGAVLSGLPSWRSLASDLKSCDDYIDAVWGYRWEGFSNKISRMEYRSILVYIIYSSLTAAIDQ